MIEDAVKIGDIYEDNDPRMMRCPIAGPVRPAFKRRVRVVDTEIIPGKPVRAVVEDTATGLRTRIAWSRLLKGGQRGFRKVVEDDA